MKLTKSVLVAMLLGIMAIQVAWAETLEELERKAFQNQAFKEPKMLNDYFAAKRNGDVDGMRNILQKVLGICGADGVNRDLFSAITNGDISQLKVSIKLGADVNAKNSSCNALMEAIKNSSSNRSGYIGLKMVELLVENGADVNTKDEGGNTALLKAIEMKREADNTNAMGVIRCLVENGADVNAKNKKGITPLIYSAGDLDLMKYLIENGAKDINSVLRYATNMEMLKYLISKGVNIKSDEGIALFFKLISKNSSWFSSDDMKAKEMQMIKFLLENGIDANVKSTKGTTALMIATKEQNLNLMKYLVSKGADVNAKDNNGKTALDMAMDLKQQGNSDIYPIIEFLLDNGVKCDDCDE